MSAKSVVWTTVLYAVAGLLVSAVESLVLYFVVAEAGISLAVGCCIGGIGLAGVIGAAVFGRDPSLVRWTVVGLVFCGGSCAFLILKPEEWFCYAHFVDRAAFSALVAVGTGSVMSLWYVGLSALIKLKAPSMVFGGKGAECGSYFTANGLTAVILGWIFSISDTDDPTKVAMDGLRNSIGVWFLNLAIAGFVGFKLSRKVDVPSPVIEATASPKVNP